MCCTECVSAFVFMAVSVWLPKRIPGVAVRVSLHCVGCGCRQVGVFMCRFMCIRVRVVLRVVAVVLYFVAEVSV